MLYAYLAFCSRTLIMFALCSVINGLSTPSTSLTMEGEQQSLSQASFTQNLSVISDNWIRHTGEKWLHIPTPQMWPTLSRVHQFSRPGYFYSDVFGAVVSEQTSYQQKFFPKGTYWSDMVQLERRCLCNRRRSRILPDLSYQALNQSITFVRTTGHEISLQWFWNDSLSDMRELNRMRRFTTTMTVYKIMILRLFEKYAVLRQIAVGMKPFTEKTPFAATLCWISGLGDIEKFIVKP